MPGARLGLTASALAAAMVTVAAQAPGRPSEPQQHTPTISFSARHDVSPTLREIPAKRVQRGREPLAPQPLRRGRRFIRQPDPVLQTSAPAATAPGPFVSFEGVGNEDGVLPPDTNGDIGPNHYVQWVNLTFAVYSRSGSLLYGPAAGNTLWSGFGGPCENQNDGDPIVLYDHLADRWILSQFAIPNRFLTLLFAPFYQCIAVSQTPDPTGAYYRYEYQFSKLNDYPKFGVWPDGYYMTINQFTSISLQYAGQGVVAFDRAAMLAGQPAQMIYFDLASDLSLGGMLPSDLDGPPPPAGSPNFFAQIDDDGAGYPADQIQLWRFHADWASPSSSTFTGPFAVPVAPFDSNLCDYARACIPQPGTSAKLDALADRLMYRLQYRNFGTHDSLVVNHTVDVDGADHAGIRWYEIRHPSGTPIVHQQGTYGPDAHHRWMGSAAMDAAGNLAVAFNVSSVANAPSIRYAARLASDPPGVLSQGEGDLIAGTGSQTHTASRWGDYSMLSVDPLDGCTFWATGEYYSLTSSAGWQTRVGAFRLPGCGTPVSPPAAPETLTASAVAESRIDLTWQDRSANESGFSIERCTGNLTACSAAGVFSTVASAAADAATYADNGLQAATTYSYRVRAFNAGGTSAYSNGAEATTAPRPVITLTHVNGTATEAGPTAAAFRISRSTAPPVPLTVSYTVGGSASNGTDYSKIPTTTTIAADAISVDIAIVPVDDSLLESTETVVLTLKAATGYVVGTPSSATISIVSDDVAPDLVVTSVTVPTVGAAGGTISVSEATKNQGSGDAPSSTTNFYLSANAALDSGDVSLGGRSVPPLLVGESHAWTGTFALPSSLAPATYYVIAKADGQGALAESSESNNNRSDTIRVGPDLAVTALGAPSLIAPGASVVVTDTTANQGGASAGASSTRFYLSPNSSWDATDRALQSRTVASMAPGGSNSSSTSVTIPADAAAGSYYLIARADDGAGVAEWSESNNTRSVLVRVGPDLSISALSAPDRGGSGLPITITDTTKNIGSADAPPSSTGFYLSSNALLDAADLKLSGLRAVGSLAAGTTSVGSTTVTLPGVSPGRWHVIANADDTLAVPETLENNNARSVTIYIGPDLIVSGVTVPSTSSGSTIIVTDTIKNVGGAPSPASTTTFYLSSNSALDAGDTLLDGQRAVGSLEPNGTNSGQTTLTIPPGFTGKYYLIVVADGGGAVTEAVETNNRVWRAITISQ